MSAAPKPVRKKPAKEFTVGQIIDRNADRMDYSDGLPPRADDRTEKVMGLLACCQRGPLGAKQVRCAKCGEDAVLLLNCGDRHCANCGGYGRHRWHEQMMHWALPCQYLHVVTTVPHDLNDLIAANPAPMLGMLMTAAKVGIAKFMKQYHGVEKAGIVQVLHTWGQRLNRHYHVHAIVTAGGLDKKQEHWTAVDVKAAEQLKAELASLFQTEYLKQIRKSIRAGKLRSPLTIEDAPALSDLIDSVTDIGWVADIQGPASPEQDGVALVGYLSRYVTGAAIGNSRLVDDCDGMITFDIRDYRQGIETTETLDERKFVRRISYHILPFRFQRVRYAGLFHGTQRYERLNQCQRLILESQLAAGSDDGDSSGTTNTNQDIDPIEPFKPPAYEATCPKCGTARGTVLQIEPIETMQFLELATLILSVLNERGPATLERLQSQWNVLLDEAVRRGRKQGTSNVLILGLSSGLRSLDSPLVQLARLRCEELIGGDSSEQARADSSRGPPSPASQSPPLGVVSR